ncbi:MAG TPA: (d)CMP kinase [Burkholderiaceae bacterium]|nr:(d)CMP kinase [Burkholderiaceae bacterium]
MTEPKTPVITIDGPTASGKGTVAKAVASQLGWQVLDSGALYRLTALACQIDEVDVRNEAGVARLARELDICFQDDKVFLRGREVTCDIRQEAIGELASKVATYAAVRQALLQRQRAFRNETGLVADGRDMGTVVFPDAELKVFLVADVEARAKRRCKQLKDKGFSAKLADLIEDMQMRDNRDYNRVNVPLIAAPDAVFIDSSHLSIEETVQSVLNHWMSRRSV